eukprot:TRINITY_DN15718_c0_g2_i1.p1 TRINITY_DN15718_c0_g2~~TRINITY_DN15718_c0_g2_i1.p1  ORF type:complete len:412 (+),score=22.59 TRINITY_DN15718_c0_g2_i1:107-1237(+)
MHRVHVFVCVCVRVYVAVCCVSIGLTYRLRKEDLSVSFDYISTDELKGGGKKCNMGKTDIREESNEKACFMSGVYKRHMFFGRYLYYMCVTYPTCDVVEKYPNATQNNWYYKSYGIALQYHAGCVAHWNKRKLDSCDVYGNIRPDSCEDKKVWNGLNWRCEDLGAAWSEHTPDGHICSFSYEESNIPNGLGCQSMAIRTGRPYYRFDEHCLTAWPCPTYENSPNRAPQRFRTYRARSVSGSDHTILITQYEYKSWCLSSKFSELSWFLCEDEQDEAVEFLLPDRIQDDPTRVVGKLRLANQRDTCVNTTGNNEQDKLVLSACEGAHDFSMPSSGYSGLITFGVNNGLCIHHGYAQVFECVRATSEEKDYWVTIVGQ